MTTAEIITKKSNKKVAPVEETINPTSLPADELIIAGFDTWEGDFDVTTLTPKQRALIRPAIMDRIDADDDAFKALAASIEEDGVVQPVTVVRDGENVFVIDGRRRVSAARNVSEEKGKPINVPVVFLPEDTEPEVLAGLVVTLDEIRKEDNMAVKAMKAAHLAGEPFNMSVPDIAKKFGVSVVAVRDWLGFHAAAPAVKKAVEQGIIAPTTAAQIAKANPDPKAQKEHLQKLVAEAEANAKAKAGKTGKAAKSGKIRVSGTAASAKKLAKKGEEGSSTKMNHAFLRKFVKHCEEHETSVSEDDIAVIKIILGDKPASRPGWKVVMKHMNAG